MCQYINNNLNDSIIGEYVGGDKTNNFYISMFQDKEREFIVTHNTNIRSVSYFTGRETELQDLRQKIEEKCKAVLVSGMGGIGKTHICRKLFEEYYKKHKDGDEFFRYIGYIEYNGDMGSSLQKCLKYKKQEQPEANQEAAWRELEYLASDGKLLLFIDNVNVSIGSDSSLERLKKIPGAIILTSRRRTFSKEFEPYRIGFLNMEQCKELYKRIQIINDGKRVKDEDESDLEYIIEKLAAKHTITIEFLAYLASERHWTVNKLREELEINGFQLEYMNEEDKLVNIQNSYEKLYNLSELKEAEQNILEAFSVFPYIPLSVEICNKWLLADAGVEENENIFSGLYRKGWLQLDIEQESYTLHPVFAQFIYTKCKPSVKNHLGLIKSCQQSLKISENGSVLSSQDYISFAESIIEKVEMQESKEQISFIMTLAHLLYHVAEYKKVKELYEKNIQISERVLGEAHPDVFTNYNNLAVVYQIQGEYGKAEELCKRNIQISKRVLGEKNLNTATSYHNLAVVYQRKGKYREAEELYEKSIQISERILGKDHPDIVNSYNNLAQIYQIQKEYRKAEELYKKNIQIIESVLGKEHLNMAISYNNLASLYENQEEYGKAEELLRRSVQIQKKGLGEEHPDIAKSYNNLAMLYKAQGEYGKAEELCRKSLQIREKVLGEESLDTATSYHNLAGIYQIQEEYRKAEELYRKSIQIQERILGEDHLDIASSYEGLALIYYNQREYKKAEELYKKSIQIRKRILGEVHLDMATSYHNLAAIYKNQREYKKAEELYKKSIQIHERILGTDHLSVASSYSNLALLYQSQGEYGKAEELCKRSVQIREKVLGEEHPDIANSYNNLALIYYSQGKYREAKELFKRSIQICERTLGEDHSVTAIGYFNLAGIYQEQGKGKIAFTYYLKAYKIFIDRFGMGYLYAQIAYKNMENAYSKWNPKGNFIEWIEGKMKELDE